MTQTEPPGPLLPHARVSTLSLFAFFVNLMSSPVATTYAACLESVAEAWGCLL